MECPRCYSREIEFVRQYSTPDYAKYGEYVALYKCKKCGCEFQHTEVTDEDIFSQFMTTT